MLDFPRECFGAFKTKTNVCVSPALVAGFAFAGGGVCDSIENMRKEKKLQFNIMFRPEKEGGFTAFVPSLPGCITYGKTLPEARRAALDAIRGYVASMKKRKEAISTDEGSLVGSVELPAKETKMHA